MSRSIKIVFCAIILCSPVFGSNGDMGVGTEPLTDGSELYPYLIEDFADFEIFSGDSAYWASGVHTNLMADIDLDPNLPDRTIYTHAPIAPDSNRNGSFRDIPFSGSFNGNGFCVCNLTIDSVNEGLGLFGCNAGFIANLGVENVNISGSPYYSGGLCGWNKSGGFINNCYTTGQIIDGSLIGGLCGNNSQASITNCYSTCKIVGNSDQYAGGVCAHNTGNIACCYSTGEVSGDVKHGGLCGFNYSSSCIVKCFWDTEASGKTFSDGGTGKTTVQMRDIQTFLTAGWDFVDEPSNGISNFWKLSTNQYPSLSIFAEDFSFHHFSGLGTEADPYLICNSVDIGSIWQQPEKCYQLANTIDLSNIQWPTAPIPFLTGSFFGNNNTISSLTINGGGFLGLFGSISSNSSIHSLHLESISLTGKGYYIGSLCGCNSSHNLSQNYASSVTINVSGSNSYGSGGLCGWNDEGILSNCHAAGSVNGNNWVGGVCGVNYNGTITECYFNGAVSGDSSVGGLCGHSIEPDAAIKDCYANATVNGSGEGIGGLCGSIENDVQIRDCSADCEVNGIGEDSKSIGGLCGENSGIITNCFSTGSVTGDESSALGGLCGKNRSGEILHCYSDARVSGRAAVGGLCGENYLALIEESCATGNVFATQPSAGGFCGYDDGTIRDCYATGDVYGNENVGGFIGYKYNNSVDCCYSTGYVFGLQNVGGFVGRFFRDDINYCFWDMETSQTTTGIGSGSSSHLYGCTTEQMQMESTFTAQWWDFWDEYANGWDDIWRLCSGYPRLMFEFSPGDIACGDGVDLNDFSYLANYWMQYCYGRADIHSDGRVDFRDLMIIIDDWLSLDYTSESISSLVAYWRLDGSADDSSGHGYHGTVYGSPYWDVFSQAGRAIQLNGIDTYIEVEGYKGIAGGDSRTCCAWIYTDSVSGEILSWGDTAVIGGKWIVRIDETGALRVEVKGGYVYGTTSVNDGYWHHIAVVLEDDGSPNISEAKLYVDGQLETSYGDVVACPVNTSVGQDVSMGVFTTVGVRYFYGLIDDVRIYDRVLTSEEIQAIMDFK